VVTHQILSSSGNFRNPYNNPGERELTPRFKIKSLRLSVVVSLAKARERERERGGVSKLQTTNSNSWLYLGIFI
jgi:hypothetical protein